MSLYGTKLLMVFKNKRHHALRATVFKCTATDNDMMIFCASINTYSKRGTKHSVAGRLFWRHDWLAPQQIIANEGKTPASIISLPDNGFSSASGRRQCDIDNTEILGIDYWLNEHKAYLKYLLSYKWMAYKFIFLFLLRKLLFYKWYLLILL